MKENLTLFMFYGDGIFADIAFFVCLSNDVYCTATWAYRPPSNQSSCHPN